MVESSKHTQITYVVLLHSYIKMPESYNQNLALSHTHKVRAKLFVESKVDECMYSRLGSSFMYNGHRRTLMEVNGILL